VTLNLVNPPTFPNLDFQRIDLEFPVPESYLAVLRRILRLYPKFSARINSYKAWRPCDGTSLVNHYLLKTEAGDYLLKLKEQPDSRNIRLLNELVAFLETKLESLVSPQQDSRGDLYPLFRDESAEYLVELVYFVDGDYFQGQDGLLPPIAEAVASLHQILREYPKKADLQENTTRNESIITSGYDDIKGAQFKRKDDRLVCWLLENQDYIRRLISDYEPVKSLPYDTQIIHGDLNRGNILLTRNSGKVYLFDFEDTIISYLPLVFELSFVIQRFILYDSPNVEKLFYRLDTFFEHYNSINHIRIDLLKDISYLLRLLSYRSTIKNVLAIQDDDNAFDEVELNKFVYLESQAFDYAKTLNDYFSNW
jgi:Ser/Thr protein kinase RdoA (MazF antagonist)